MPRQCMGRLPLRRGCPAGRVDSLHLRVARIICKRQAYAFYRAWGPSPLTSTPLDGHRLDNMEAHHRLEGQRSPQPEAALGQQRGVLGVGALLAPVSNHHVQVGQGGLEAAT